jgi:hypothetical protein
MTYAPTKHAEINELVDELFSLCDRMLKIEGKLVMLYPFTKDNYE